jgi:hypothetical protein
MGSWDCYCAICGGTFGRCRVSPKPRTNRFRRRERKARELTERGENGVDNEEDDDTSGSESLDSYDEGRSYDPEIISEADVEWTATLHVLGFNPDAPGAGKYDFLSLYQYTGNC